MKAMLAAQVRNLFFGFAALVVAMLAFAYPEAALSIVVTAISALLSMALQTAAAIAGLVSSGAAPGA